MIPPLVVTERQFDLLARGGGDPEAIAVLLAGQYSRNVLLVQVLLDSAGRACSRGVNTLRDAYALLAIVQRTHPDIVTAALGQPHVSLWAADCLRADAAANGPGRALTEGQYGYLACLAASAALRAGADFEIGLPVLRGTISLPGLGTLIPRTAAGGGIGRISGSGGRATVTLADQPAVTVGPASTAPGWRPHHLLRGRADGEGTAVSVLLDDRDPYRAPPWLNGASPLDPGPPLRRAEVSRWSQLFSQAWRVLLRDHGQHVAAMAAGLRALVPMRTREGTQNNSATALDAFGLILLTPPRDHLGLALTLLHEFQHGKLAALTPLVPLHDADAEPRFYAPWRDDPRPLGALFHGAYAHLAVAAFWRQLARQGGREADVRTPIAQVKFAEYRDDVRQAIDQLASSGQLTAMGERFVAGMTATLDDWRSDPLPRDVLRLSVGLRASDIP